MLRICREEGVCYSRARRGALVLARRMQMLEVYVVVDCGGPAPLPWHPLLTKGLHPTSPWSSGLGQCILRSCCMEGEHHDLTRTCRACHGTAQQLAAQPNSTCKVAGWILLIIKQTNRCGFPAHGPAPNPATTQPAGRHLLLSMRWSNPPHAPMDKSGCSPGTSTDKLEDVRGGDCAFGGA